MRFASHQLFSVKTPPAMSEKTRIHAFIAVAVTSIFTTISLLSNKKLLPASFRLKELLLQLCSQKSTSKFSGVKAIKSQHLATSFTVAKPFQTFGFGMKSRRGSPPPSLVRTGALRNIFIFRTGA